MQFRQPEIEDFDLAGRGHEDIGGFNITVHDAAGVRRFQGPGDLYRELQHLLDPQRPAFDLALEGIAL